MVYGSIESQTPEEESPLESGGSTEMKICGQCGKNLPLDDFYVCQGKIKRNCRECHKWFVSRWQRRNPEKVADAKSRAKNKSIHSGSNGIGAQHASTLQSCEPKTSDTKRCSKKDDAENWLSSALRGSIIARWLPFTGYGG